MTRTAERQTSWDDLEAAHVRATIHVVRHEPTPAHEPTVAVLTCADARVSPARSFDLPAGSLFVVRVAGATATTEAVASLTYAVEALGVPTVVVLGHTECGAVDAALQGVDDPAIEPLVAPIRPALPHGCADTACAVPAHVAATVASLAADPGPLGDAVRSNRVTVHGAVIDITDGSLTRLPPTPPRQEPS
jgi:carbonic anhydrase